MSGGRRRVLQHYWYKIAVLQIVNYHWMGCNAHMHGQSEVQSAIVCARLHDKSVSFAEYSSFFAKEPYKRDYILQMRPSLRFVA